MKKYSFLIVLVLSTSLASAQSNSTKKEHKKHVRDSIKEDKLAKGKILISPFAAPGYTPELGGLIVVGGLLSFKTNPADTLIQRSSMPFSLSYSTTGAIVGNAMLKSYWFKDKLRINGAFWYKDMPDNYWGIGYDAAFNNHQSDSTTAYHRNWWQINPRFLYEIKNNFFLGLNIDYNYTQGSDASEGVANDSIYNHYQDKPMNSGIGLIFHYDSRDVPVDAKKGMLLDFRTTFYSNTLGGDNTYQVYQLDYRQFKTLQRKGQVLAWQIKARVAEGEVPYGEMSQIGTPFDLRGYMWGRYRNNDMLFFLAEYRYTFLNKSEKLGKHGVVTWIGSGTVFNSQTIKDNTNRWLPNYGIGYRFELQPRMHVRLDFGIGRETSGVYFNFTQAF